MYLLHALKSQPLCMQDLAMLASDRELRAMLHSPSAVLEADAVDKAMAGNPMLPSEVQSAMSSEEAAASAADVLAAEQPSSVLHGAGGGTEPALRAVAKGTTLSLLKGEVCAAKAGTGKLQAAGCLPCIPEELDVLTCGAVQMSKLGRLGAAAMQERRGSLAEPEDVGGHLQHIRISTDQVPEHEPAPLSTLMTTLAGMRAGGNMLESCEWAAYEAAVQSGRCACRKSHCLLGRWRGADLTSRPCFAAVQSAWPSLRKWLPQARKLPFGDPCPQLWHPSAPHCRSLFCSLLPVMSCILTRRLGYLHMA